MQVPLAGVHQARASPGAQGPGTHEGPVSLTAREPCPKSAWWWTMALGNLTPSLSPRVRIRKVGKMDQLVPRAPCCSPCRALSCFIKGTSWVSGCLPGLDCRLLGHRVAAPQEHWREQPVSCCGELGLPTSDDACGRAGTAPVALAQGCRRPTGMYHPATPWGTADTVSLSVARREPRPAWDSQGWRLP